MRRGQGLVRWVRALRGWQVVLGVTLLISVPVAAGLAFLALREGAGRYCTMIGSEDGVAVDLGVPRYDPDRVYRRLRARGVRGDRLEAALVDDRRRYAERADVRRIVVCAGDRCRTMNAATASALGLSTIPLKADGGDRVEVTVAIDRRSRALQFARGEVRLRRHEPNGPGCGTWWRAHARVDGTRVVQTQNP